MNKLADSVKILRPRWTEYNSFYASNNDLLVLRNESSGLYPLYLNANAAIYIDQFYLKVTNKGTKALDADLKVYVL